MFNRTTARMGETNADSGHHLRAPQELAAIDAEIAALTERKRLILALRETARALAEIGYSPRQVRDMFTGAWND